MRKLEPLPFLSTFIYLVNSYFQTVISKESFSNSWCSPKNLSVFFIIDNEFIPFVYISNGVPAHFQQTLRPEGQSHADFGLI